MSIDKKAAEKIITESLLIRLVEEEIVERYGAIGEEQKMRCPVHLSIGQEGIAVGACQHLTNNDKVFSTHRCHAHYLAKGGDLDRMTLEIHGKIGGCLDGRGGSMHLTDDSVGMTMSVPIVGSSIPLAVGAALANKIDGKKDVVLVFFGDGAVEEGVFYESMNFASLMNLPIIFVCENNLFSIYTHISERQPDRPLTDLATPHKMPAVEIDGTDPFKVADEFKPLIEQARESNQPSFIVLKTYRTREHCGVNFDDHLGYRNEEESEEWKGKDPITVAIDVVKSKGLLEDSEIDEIRNDLKAKISKSFDEAEKAPLPTPEMGKKYVCAA